MRRLLLLFVLVAMIAGLSACSSNTTTAPRGTVSVLLTDAPIDLTGVKAVNVTLTSVILYPAETDGASGDSGGTTMDLENVVAGASLTLNLLDLQNGKSVTVATANAPSGTYSRLRMEIASAELVRAGDGADAPDRVDPIVVPSGKVDIPVTFTVPEGDGVSVTLDFDAAMSVQVNSTNGQNSYLLRPVITPVGTSHS